MKVKVTLYNRNNLCLFILAAHADPTTREATATATAPMIAQFTCTMGPSLGDTVISSISDEGATEGFGESGVVVVVDETEVLAMLGTAQNITKDS